ncbi:MAG: DUF3526 domain-containing protein [Microscillaceae bacterium]|nr:DUF3526 domain-containing protein [Microscillaceae bacterium]
MPIFFINTFLFALAAFLIDSLQDFGKFSPGALLMLYAVYLLYFAVFCNLTLIVSALSKNSSIALVILLGIWMLSCLGAPKAAANFADALYPYPSRQEFLAEVNKDKEKGLNGHNPWSKEAQQLEKEVLKKYKVDSLSQLPFNFDGYLMQKGEEHEAEIFFKHYALLKAQYQNQSTIYRALAWVSPFLPTRFLSMAIAHTDYQAHWNFADAAEKYRVALQKALNDNFAENSKYGDWEYQADKSLWKSIPKFSYEPPSLGFILQENLSNLIVLLFWLGVSFAGLYFISQKL